MSSKSDSGDFIGYELDLLKAVSHHGHFRYRLISVDWDNGFAALEHGKITALLSSVTVTEARKQIFLFSPPYFNAGAVLVVPKSIKDHTSISPRRVISFPKISLTPKLKEPLASLKIVDGTTIKWSMQDILTGNYGGLICPLPVAAHYCNALKETKGLLKILPDRLSDEWYAIAIRKGAVSVYNRICLGVEKTISSGEAADFERKWIWNQ